jgi:hypothetical protein
MALAVAVSVVSAALLNVISSTSLEMSAAEN